MKKFQKYQILLQYTDSHLQVNYLQVILELIN